MAEIVMTSGFVFNGYIHQVCDDGGITSGDDLGVALIKNEYNNQIHPIAQETYDNIAQYIKEGATTVIEGVGVARVSSQATSSYFVKITAPENSPSTSPNNVFPIPNASGTGSLVIYTNPNSSDPADKVLVCWFGLSEEVTASTFDLSFDDGVILKYSPAQTYLYDIVTSAGDGKVKVDDTDTYPGFLYNKIMPGEGIVIDTSARGDEKFLKIGTSGCALWEYASNALRPKDNTKHLEIYTDGNVIVPSIGSTYALTIHSEAGTSGNGLALDVYGSQDIHNGKENNIALYVKNTNTNAQVAYLVQQNTSNSAPAFQVDNRGTFNTVRLHSYNSSNEAPVFHIQSSGTGAAINVQGNGPAFNAEVATSSSMMTLVNEGPGGVNIQSSGVSATLNVENVSNVGPALIVKGNALGPAVLITNNSGVVGTFTGNTIGPAATFQNNGGGSAASFYTSSSYETVWIQNAGTGPGLAVNGGIQIDRGTIEPTGKFEGMPFYNTTDKKYRYYDGTEWKDFGGSLPITAMGDLVVGDENGNAIRLPIGTSGQFLGVNTSGELGYINVDIPENIFTKSSPSGNYYVGNPTSGSCSGYKFIGVINNGGTKIGSDISGVTVTHYADVEYDMPWSGTTTAWDICKSITMKGNYYGTKYMRTSLFPYLSNDGKQMNGGLLIFRRSDGGMLVRTTDVLYTSAFMKKDDMNVPSESVSYVPFNFKFGSSTTTAPDYSAPAGYGKAHMLWSGGSLELSTSAKTYTQSNILGLALLVRSGLSQFKGPVQVQNQSFFTNTLNATKIVIGGKNTPDSGNVLACNGIVYGYGETSARDALTAAGKDPGRQYYTTDDNRVNVYNNTTSSWDKVAYLSDVGGGTNWYCGSFTSANRPANPTEGQYGYDTSIDCIIYYIGSEWKNAAGAVV